jgi:hypothetical protein
MGAKVGTPVLYTLTSGDANEINRRRKDAEAFRRNPVSDTPGGAGRTGHQLHVGNNVAEGEQYPAVIARVFHPETTTANLQVTLDGNDTYWATSRTLGEGPGRYQNIED